MMFIVTIYKVPKTSQARVYSHTHTHICVYEQMYFVSFQKSHRWKEESLDSETEDLPSAGVWNHRILHPHYHHGEIGPGLGRFRPQLGSHVQSQHPRGPHVTGSSLLCSTLLFSAQRLDVTSELLKVFFQVLRSFLLWWDQRSINQSLDRMCECKVCLARTRWEHSAAASTDFADIFTVWTDILPAPFNVFQYRNVFTLPPVGLCVLYKQEVDLQKPTGLAASYLVKLFKISYIFSHAVLVELCLDLTCAVDLMHSILCLLSFGWPSIFFFLSFFID